MFAIDTDLQGEVLREANVKELEEPSGIALALRDWSHAAHFSQLSFRQVDGSTRAHIGRWERSLLVHGPFLNLPSGRSAPGCALPLDGALSG